MLIKLTNASEQFAGQQLLINTDHIISVFEIKSEGTDELLTHVYAVTKESWLVKEDIETIYKMLK